MRQANPEKIREFSVGDKVVYPSHGIGEVAELNTEGESPAYIIRILDTSCQVRVAVERATEIGLRGLLTMEEIDDVFDILRESTVMSSNSTWNRRVRLFKSKLASGSAYEIAEVVRDLSKARSKKKLSWKELILLDLGINLLSREIAFASGQDVDKVRCEIRAIYEN
jgi:CarD family transcriptional regulator